MKIKTLRSNLLKARREDKRLHLIRRRVLLFNRTHFRKRPTGAEVCKDLDIQNPYLWPTSADKEGNNPGITFEEVYPK